jgi:predicted dehydrogenase
MDAGSYCVAYVRYLLGTDDFNVESTEVEFAYPHVDKHFKAVLKTGETVVNLKCSIFTFIPEISLKVEGADGSVLEATNWVAPQLLYNKVQLMPKAGEKVVQKWDTDVNSYQCQLEAFVNAIQSGDYDCECALAPLSRCRLLLRAR